MLCPSLDSYPGLSVSKLQTVSLYQNKTGTPHFIVLDLLHFVDIAVFTN